MSERVFSWEVRKGDYITPSPSCADWLPCMRGKVAVVIRVLYLDHAWIRFIGDREIYNFDPAKFDRISFKEAYDMLAAKKARK